MSKGKLNSVRLRVLTLARELCEQLDAERSDDPSLLELRLLRAVEECETELARERSRDVGARGAVPQENES